MDKPVVLLVAGSADYGSGESLILDYLGNLKNKSYIPILIFPGRGPLEVSAREMGVETIVIPGQEYLTELRQLWRQPVAWVYNFFSFIRLSKVIRDRRVRLVVSLSFINWTGALAARQEGIPHIWMIREILSRKESRLNFFWGKWLASRLANDLSVKILLESKNAAELFSRKRTRQKAEVLPPAIDLNRFWSKKKMDQAELTDPKKGVAIFNNQANPSRISKVIQAVLLAYENPEKAKLFIFFPGLKKKTSERLKIKLAEEVPEAGSVLEFPDLDSLPFLQKRFLAAILIPGFDPLSRLVLENGLAGIPVVIESGPAAELILQGKTGFVINRGNEDELTSILAKLLESETLRTSIGCAAQEIFSKQYNLQDWEKKFTGLLEEILFFSQS